MHGFEYERGQGEKNREDLSLHFWLLAEDLDGEVSFQELSFGLYSFARGLAVACLHRQPDMFPEKLGRTCGWSERGLSSRSTAVIHRIAADLLDPLFKAGCVWITQVSIIAGVGGPLNFLKRKCSQRLSIADPECWSCIRSGRIDVPGRDEHALKPQWSVSWRQSFQEFTAPTEAGIPPSKLLLTKMSWRCGWNDLRIMRWELTRTGGLADVAFMVVDVVRRELGTYLFRGVRSCVAGLHQRMGSYQHVLVTLIMENALESRACRHGTDSRCSLGY